MRKTNTPVLLSIYVLNLVDLGLRKASRRGEHLHTDVKSWLKGVRKALYTRLLADTEEFPWYRSPRPVVEFTQAELDEMEAEWAKDRASQRKRSRASRGLTW